MKNYYETLGVTKAATEKEIKKAFHTVAQKYHPDKKGGDEKKFKEASEAYAVLGDKKKRAEYDAYGHTFAGGGGAGQQQGFGGFDFSQFQQGFGNGGVEFDLGDIFGDIFGGGARNGRSQQQRGRDISMDIELDFSEAIFGIRRTILLNKVGYCDTCEGTGAKNKTETKTCEACNGKGSIQETRRSIMGTFTSARECDVCFGKGSVPKQVCSKCKGQGVLEQQEEITVAIPSGIDNGEMIRLPNKGEAMRGGIAGDLYIKIHVKSHKTFTRNGKNILMTLNVKLSDALLGGVYSIPTLDKPIDLKIPVGIRHGEVLRIPKHGIPTSGGSRGDLLVTVHIDLPQKLSKGAKKLVEELKKEGV